MHLLTSVFLSLSLLFSGLPMINTQDTKPADTTLTVEAPSAVLMEASTGTIVYEKEPHTVLRPASITKIMTLILIFDALNQQSISLTDEVTVSEHAASMGGSQVFLEPGEVQTVETMIKCISIASANDACVAMAEYIAGSEEAFVARMNERAAALGMNDTNFINCCGLDVDNHVTTAYDVALMSRELITKYPKIHDYSTIWMENITHVTKKGSSEFGLTNTNKLIKQYPYANGLKTGSTGLAKYCVSATAKKDGITLIAVIMAAPDYKVRFTDASMLLDHGFAVCRLYSDQNPKTLSPLPVKGGIKNSVPLRYEGTFSYLDTSGENSGNITSRITLPKEVKAPVAKNEEAGRITYTRNGRELGFVRILYDDSVSKASYRDYLSQAFLRYFSL